MPGDKLRSMMIARPYHHHGRCSASYFVRGGGRILVKTAVARHHASGALRLPAEMAGGGQLRGRYTVAKLGIVWQRSLRKSPGRRKLATQTRFMFFMQAGVIAATIWRR